MCECRCVHVCENLSLPALMPDTLCLLPISFPLEVPPSSQAFNFIRKLSCQGKQPSASPLVETLWGAAGVPGTDLALKHLQQTGGCHEGLA